jgi:hypothetical protein
MHNTKGHWNKARIVWVGFGALILIKVLWVSLMYVSGDQLLDGLATDDLLHRHAFLRQQITNRNEERPDKQFLLTPQFQGEWALTSCSMYTMALCNLGFLYPDMRSEFVGEIHILIDRVLQTAYRQFDEEAWSEDPLSSLATDHGHVWYLANLNLMLTCYRLLGGDARYDVLTHRISKKLAHAISHDAAMIAETYPNERYIPDNSVLLASLKNHDVAFGTHYGEVIRKWRETAAPRLLDDSTGTLVFAITAGAAEKSRSRSSGAAFALVCLFHADPEYFEEQYKKVKRVFGLWFLPKIAIFPGMAALKESADGSWDGDIDSGPVLFGASTSGTGFGIGCARAARDSEFLSQLLVTAEMVGSSIDWNGERHYLFAPLVGEAIMFAMKTSTPWDGRYVSKDNP